MQKIRMKEKFFTVSHRHRKEKIYHLRQRVRGFCDMGFYFKTSNRVPFEVILNPNGLVNIEAYQRHTDEIEQVNSKVEDLSLDLKKQIDQMDG